jgi:hypothetical protein
MYKIIKFINAYSWILNFNRSDSITRSRSERKRYIFNPCKIDEPFRKYQINFNLNEKRISENKWMKIALIFNEFQSIESWNTRNLF